MKSHRFLPALLVLFVGSGCAALIYEVVWYQLLELVIGSSAVSMAVLLGTFMGGLCLGSLGLPRLVPARHHPLRVYAILELGIGIIGLAVLVVVPLLGRVYAVMAGAGPWSVALRGLVAGVCLLPPTFLMGATLPALARWVEATPRGVSWLGFFYAGNTAGAVVGSLFAGFYLLRVHDMPTATCVAVAINVAVAALSWTIATLASRSTATADVAEAPAPAAADSPARGARDIYLAIALSGMTALAAEVVWTRLLSLLIGGTTYTFSLLLAAFLAGLGLGSSGGAALARNLARPRLAFGLCQAFLCAAIAWGGYLLTMSLPYWPIDPSLAPTPWLEFHLDLARAMIVVLPAAILWGASFPLALAAAARRGADPARFVGGLYAANTVGAIAGSLGASLVVASLGSQRAQQILVVACAVSALIVLRPFALASDRRSGLRFAIGLVVVGILGGILLPASIHAVPGSMVAYGRWAPTRAAGASIIYVGEGYNASVAVSRLSNGVLNYHNAGKIQASSEPQDMRLQRMLGHLTTLVPERPRSVFVIGCGAGVTAGAVSIDPRVERVTIAEIEPLVVKTVSTYFGEHNFQVIRNPKVRVRVDDGRHVLQTSTEKYDAITSDPLDPWVKGAAMLYTKEFFELVKSRLNPGGVVTIFVQLYESSEEAVKSEIATFLDAFPNGLVFANTIDGAGYDLVLLGSERPVTIDIDAMEARLQRPEYAPVAFSLSEVGIQSALQLLANYAGNAGDLRGWTKDAQINHDRNLRLQYLAGLGLNLRQSAAIYSAMVTRRRFPDGLFVGTDASVGLLRQAIEGGY
jgi:spermidine synthase